MREDNKHINKGGFKVPADYFEDFEKKLLNTMGKESEKSGITSDPGKTGFAVPDAYFDSLEDTIIQKMETEDGHRKVVTLFSKQTILYVSGIAAMVAVIFSLYVHTTTRDLDFDTLKIADIEAYLNENTIDLSTDEIASLLDDQMSDLDAIEKKQFSDETLVEYLSDEDLEDELIYTD